MENDRPETVSRHNNAMKKKTGKETDKALNSILKITKEWSQK